MSVGIDGGADDGSYECDLETLNVKAENIRTLFKSCTSDSLIDCG